MCNKSVTAQPEENGEIKMAQITVTKGPHEDNTEEFPYVKSFDAATNVRWDVLSGKVSVSTDTRQSRDYGGGSPGDLVGDSQGGARQITVTASSNGNVRVQINF